MPRSRIRLMTIIALAVTASLFASPSFGQRKGSEGSALGIFLGQPTGISFRLGLGKEQSLEAKAAWNFAANGGDAAVALQANWLMEFPGVLVIQDADFPLYVGAGVQATVGKAASIALRVPGGIVYRFDKAPVELALELGLGMQLLPATAFVGSGGIGIRYRF
jgi:hypothetical protein